MKEKETVRMEINIGGVRMMLTVPFDHQNAVRDTEALVGELYNSWLKKYSDKKPNEVLAMVAYQFAAHYSELLAQQRRALMEADMIDDRLSDLLRNQDEAPLPPEMPDYDASDLFSDLSIGL